MTEFFIPDQLCPGQVGWGFVIDGRKLSYREAVDYLCRSGYTLLRAVAFLSKLEQEFYEA